MSASTSASWDSVRHLRSFHKAAPAIANTITAVSRAADDSATSGRGVFHVAKVPSVSVARYLVRLIKYSDCSPSVWVTMFILLDRFARKVPLTPQTTHRAMAAAFVMAVFVVDDGFMKFSFYARVCGLRDAAEVQELVCAFFSECSFEVDLAPEEFADVEAALLRSSG
eukprot:TRINITY_DN1341_c0_g1_i1.p1 TRINITY_DN1341_c0_g1~~TRINITY_DN1341_c0_g1_i1.p1  ORF type:complete len:190 (+),score=61.45 TRINITY_DN1341_c0_g1_i1:68-571(+)